MSSKARILVVEDTRSLVRLYERILEKEGHEVITAFDGQEGLRKAQQERPDVILLDIFMPDMDGYNALATIRSQPATKDIPVVMVSTAGYRLNKLLAEDLGAVGFITKPVDPAQLLDVIARLVPNA